MIPPDRRPEWDDWSRRHLVFWFAVQALGRELVVGMALYACADTGRIAHIGASLLALALLMLASRWFSLLQLGSWRGVAAESLLLYSGSLCVGNVLLMTLGPCHWALPL